MTTIDVSCFYCHTPNRVGISVSFYEAKAWYTCHACGKNTRIEVTQAALDLKDARPQTGVPIDG